MRSQTERRRTSTPRFATTTLTNSEASTATFTEKEELRSRVASALSKCFTNFLKDWVSAVQYRGHCWIPEEDFELLCKALADAPSVTAFSMEDEQMLRAIDEWGPSALIHVRVFSTLHESNGHRTIEVSGTLSLGVLLSDSGAQMIGGITEEDPIVVKFHCDRTLYELDKYVPEAEIELVPLFRIPKQYGQSFARLIIDQDVDEFTLVSRYQAECDLVTAVRQAPEKPKKHGLICDSCGQEAGPNQKVTETYKAYGIYTGTEPLRALDVMSVDCKIQALCSRCSRELSEKQVPEPEAGNENS